jgi:kinesin family protein 6/9
MSSLNAALAGMREQIQSQRSGDESARSSISASARKPAPAPSPQPSREAEIDGGGDDDDDSPIQVFCRIRPSRGAAASKSVLAVDAEEKKVEFNVSKANPDSSYNTVNNTREQFKFQFNGLFDEGTTQGQIFETVGRKVINNVTAGYNGTIFAYGQTGSGKTYTMMGGTDKYEDRGLIPRTLTYLFEWMAERSSELQCTLRISYLEIYNDKGYDLLDPAHEHKSLEELPRVILLEGENGMVHFKNLGELPAASVDEALNLLFVGDTNRVVCETPSNDASTRSHCIFMISLEMKERGTAKVRRAKMNLVDLAGSERVKSVGRTNCTCTLLWRYVITYPALYHNISGYDPLSDMIM